MIFRIVITFLFLFVIRLKNFLVGVLRTFLSRWNIINFLWDFYIYILFFTNYKFNLRFILLYNTFRNFLFVVVKKLVRIWRVWRATRRRPAKRRSILNCFKQKVVNYSLYILNFKGSEVVNLKDLVKIQKKFNTINLFIVFFLLCYLYLFFNYVEFLTLYES